MPDQTIDGWGYLYIVATGVLVSEGTVFVDPLPAGMALLERPGGRHDAETERWDPAARDVVPYTDQDRIDELKVRRAELADEITRRGGAP